MLLASEYREDKASPWLLRRFRRAGLFDGDNDPSTRDLSNRALQFNTVQLLSMPLLQHSLWTHSSFHNSFVLVAFKSLGFIPVMTLHFLHGVLVSSQCLCVLRFCCKTIHEHAFDLLN